MTRTFNVADEVEDLAYDFTKALPGVPGAAGAIPEPSAKQIAGFFTAIAQLIRDQLDLSKPDSDSGAAFDPENPADLMRALDSFTEAQFVKVSKQMCAAHAKLCSNTPSEAILAKLPYRHQQAFFGWVQGMFLPNQSSAATSPSPAAQNSDSSTTSPAANSATA